MWRLPPLKWNESEWRLPLGCRPAAELVEALLDDSQIALQSLAKCVSATPTLALWILFRSEQWRSSAPTDTADLAHWLLTTGIPEGMISVEPDSESQPGSTLAKNDVDARSPTSLIEILRHFPSIMAQAGPSLSAVEWSQCPWLPQWLAASSLTTPAAIADFDEPDPIARRTAALLPAVLRHLQRLQNVTAQFHQTLEQEKLESLKELAYGASHEINNPLANIATRAQSLLQDETDAEKKRKLATIAAQAFRAHEMISDMMLFAKPPALNLELTDIKEIVRQTVRELSSEARTQKTEIRTEFASEDAIIVNADRTQLTVAVKALLRNALEALGSGGTIGITPRALDADAAGKVWIEIVVRDSGPGIAPEVRKHLFDPFYSGREAGRGLGFGLSKAWRIAELHEGTLTVESEPGFGATFRLRIPSS